MIMEITELYKIFSEHPVVTTDSRDCPEGSLFFALKGASFDGNKFAAMALDKGCAYAVVDEAVEDVEMKGLCFFLAINCLISITTQNRPNLFGCRSWLGKIDFTKQDSCIIEGCGDTIHKEDLISQITIFAGFLGSCAGL